MTELPHATALPAASTARRRSIAEVSASYRHPPAHGVSHAPPGTPGAEWRRTTPKLGTGTLGLRPKRS